MNTFTPKTYESQALETCATEGVGRWGTESACNPN